MEARVGRAVLVDERVPVTKQHDAGNRPAILCGKADPESIAHALEQVPKPRDGLRRSLMPAPREQQQPVKGPEVRVRRSCFTAKRFSFRTTDLPLNRILVTPLKEH